MFVRVLRPYSRWYRQCHLSSKSVTDGVAAFKVDSRERLPLILSPASEVAMPTVLEGFIKKVLPSFPTGIQCAYAYGSGAFQQHGTIDITKNMLDFIFVVDDPVQWHAENIEMNKSHYSFLKFLSPRGVNYIQKQYGAGIYFNTLVPFEGRLIKYGVISTDRLINDLLDWETLYVSGRLHKPVLTLKEPTNTDLKVALQINLQSAVHASLIQLPDTFSEEELYICIAGLSYLGDFRMTVGEDRHKVVNIVKPNISKFQALYKNILDSEEHLFFNDIKMVYEQYPNHIAQYHHLNLLPKTVHINLVALGKQSHAIPDTEEVIRNLANNPHCGDYVANSIAQIVKRSSWSQSLKTAFTAGFVKSVKYSLKKMKKMMKSLQK